MRYGKYLILALFFLSSGLFAQEKLNIKAKDFNPYKIVHPPVVFNQNLKGYTESGIYAVTQFPNIRVFSSPYNQTEPSVAVSSASPYNLFIGSNTDFGMGYYYSLNSGSGWSGGDIMPNSVYYSTNPFVAYGSGNNTFYNYFDDFIVTDRSTNSGADWTGRIIVPSSTLYDMNSIAVDNNPSSPYYNRIYVVWSNFNLTQPRVVLSYSTDGGSTYSSPQNIGSPLANHYEQGAKVVVSTGGTVYCVWATPNISNSNIEDKIGFTKSTDGGITWSAPSYPITINGIRGYLPPTGVRVNSFPSLAIDKSTGAYDGTLYLCWAQKSLAPSGSDADICYSYSVNNGSTWSAVTRINDDAINNGKNQFMPWITVDNVNSKVSIVFYDNRDTYQPDSCDVFAAISSDHGNSFTNIKVSDHPQRPVPLSGYADGYYSDYIGVTAANDVVYPVWTDNRNGVAQIYTARVVLAPYIVHTPLKDTEVLTGPYNVNAVIQTFGSTLAAGETKTFWGRGSITDSITMTNTGNNWSAAIPGNSSPATYYYYIKTKDLSGRISTLPLNAPANKFSFQTGPDVTKPVINHRPIDYSNWILWPDTINAYVSDNTGIDSVWVRWYLNDNPANTKQFKLTNISGDHFKGVFNSSLTGINPNDSVYYKVIASDNSSNHNKDSSQIYHFTVNSMVEIKLGSGNITTSYPYRTFYMDSRTDMLYTASEISAIWGNGLARIMYFGFNVLNASPQTMNGFTVKMQLTTNNTLTGFTNSGWTTVRSGNYTIANTGWQYLFLTTPFHWDGTSNILVEVCYDNNTTYMNSSVAATPMTGKTWHQYQDLPNGNGCSDLNTGSAQTNRPNISFIFNSIIGINDENSTMPKEYKLSQNYPNPFNPVTKISFSVPRKSFVTLKVYDILGKEVARLVSDNKPAGNYSVDFDGSSLSSGVYFYKLEAGEFVTTKRMVLIK
jgi:hypothetical protein